MKIISVVGARPNFMKIAPFIKAINQWNANVDADKHSQIEHILVHTGQHYDDKMSQSFFKALDIPDANINLGIGSGSHAHQVGMTMIEFEKVLRMHHPDWVVVVGDVNATCACSITAKKEGIKVAHIEAGLRSHDNSMPEEINRLVTDRLSDLLFTPDRMSSDNLYKEGANPKTVRFVGNIMIDTLEAQKQKAMMLTIDDIIGSNLFPGRNLPLPKIKQFGVITLHRPSNVDNHDAMNAIINFFVNEAALELPLLWPIHPRTLKQMQIDGTFDKVTSCQNIILLQPLGYHELLKFNIEAIVVMSDSGGLQEECCVLGTPCLIMRKNTERPVTLRENGGVGVLVGNDIDLLRSEFQSVMKNITRKFFRPELWDGNTATRIVQELVAAK